MTIDYETFYPRDTGNRFRVYGWRDGANKCLATAPDSGHFGLAILTLQAEGEEINGIYDAVERKWIISPWRKGER